MKNYYFKTKLKFNSKGYLLYIVYNILYFYFILYQFINRKYKDFVASGNKITDLIYLAILSIIVICLWFELLSKDEGIKFLYPKSSYKESYKLVIKIKKIKINLTKEEYKTLKKMDKEKINIEKEIEDIKEESLVNRKGE